LSPAPSRAGRSWRRATLLRRRRPSHWLDGTAVHVRVVGERSNSRYDGFYVTAAQ
jgi:hypothetical protein